MSDHDSPAPADFEPLPVDAVDRIRRDFGVRAMAVQEFLLVHRRTGSSDYIGDRLIRCIVFSANGDEQRLRHLIELEQWDHRDVIMLAEYDGITKRLRDFNRPFESAEIE